MRLYACNIQLVLFLSENIPLLNLMTELCTDKMPQPKYSLICDSEKVLNFQKSLGSVHLEFRCQLRL